MEKVRWKKNKIVGLSTRDVVVGNLKRVMVRYKGRILICNPIENTADVKFKLVVFNPSNYGEDMDYRIDLLVEKLVIVPLDRSDFLNPACRFGGKQLISFVR
jgi:hypothetical protein